MDGRKRKGLWIVLWVVMIAVLAAAVAGIIVLRSMDKDKKEEAGSVSMAIVDPEESSGEQELTDANRAESSGENKLAESGAEEGQPEQSLEESQEGSEECPETAEGNAETRVPEPEVAADSGYYGALQVIGTQLCDGNGNAVQLRGISTHGLAWFPDYVNAELFRELHDEWKANVVRLAMYTAEYGGYCSGGDQKKLKQLIADGVKYATDNDMYVIIDWHILSDGDPNTYKEEAKAFFGEMSETYSGYDNVLYEICNEPNGGTGWSSIKSYAEEIIPVIRANDEDAVILVGTPNWSQYVDQAAADPITAYSNIMYTLHFYAATHTDGLRSTMAAAIDAGLPVFVSEYGICDASGNGAIDEKQANAWVELMDRYGVSYVAWNLSNKNETSAVFKNSCNKLSGFAQEDLSSSGRWLYDMLTGKGEGMTSGDSRRQTGSENAQGGQTENRSDSSKQESDTPVSSVENTEQKAQLQGDGTLQAELQLVNSWESEGKTFYQYSLTITNQSQDAVDGWQAVIAFSGEFSLSNAWCGTYSVNGNRLEITPADYNARLESGAATGDIGFIVSGGSGMTAENVSVMTAP